VNADGTSDGNQGEGLIAEAAPEAKARTHAIVAPKASESRAPEAERIGGFFTP